MKTKLVNIRVSFATFLLALNSLCPVFNASGQTSAGTILSTNGSDYLCVQRGPHSKVWQRTVVQTNQSGIVTTNLHSYTELATGLCYLQDGQYIDSVEQISPAADGAEAVQGRHQVHWTANANTPGGAVHVKTPDGRELHSTVYGLAYYDTASGSNVMLALLQDSMATIVGSNTLVYGNAFSNLTADIRYTYSKAGLSQDIVLKQNPPPPAEYGLNPATTRLQVITEFFNPPSPVKTTVTTNGLSDDRILSFGEMNMGVGHAFLFPNNAKTQSSPVVKHWTTIDNRTFLMEEIGYSSISNLLTTLHSSTIKLDRSRVKRIVSLDLPKTRKMSAITKAQPVARTTGMSMEPAFVLDYNLLSHSTNNFTFQGDTTYFVSGLVSFGLTNVTIEGGTVIKFADTGRGCLNEGYPVTCLTGPYRPAVFTSMDDNSVGDQIDGSTGNPVTSSATYWEYFDAAALSHARFSYAGQAVEASVTSFSDCQFVQCNTAIALSYYGELGLYNVLFSGCGTAVAWLDSDSVDAENVTMDNGTSFVQFVADDTTGSFTLKNCLFTGVTQDVVNSLNNYNNNCGGSLIAESVYQPDQAPYVSCGAGNYYLAPGTFQNQGTTDINPALLNDLQTKTTYPPAILNGTINYDYSLSPAVQRDNSGATVDVGYHYDPLDYAVSINVSGATVTVQPGTALGMCSGVWLYSTATFNCAGTATAPVYMVGCNTVQEQSATSVDGPGSCSISTTQIDGTVNAANFLFTKWSVLADLDMHVDALGGYKNYLVSFQNCEFYNGQMYIPQKCISSTNCLYRRVSTTLSDAHTSFITNTFCNNLFWAGELAVTHIIIGGFQGPWTFCDNLFDHTVITDSGSTIDFCSNNAYVTTKYGTLSPNNNDIHLTASPAYEVGALGQYYYPTSQLNLINTGSQTAVTAGLDQYTVLTNNIPDGQNMVSIGYHYYALTPPTAYDNNDLQTCENTSLSFYGSASDQYGLTLTFGIVTGPANGSASCTPTGQFTYSPNHNFTGTDSLTYKVNNCFMDSAPATCTITVGDAYLQANEQTAMVGINQPLNLTLGASDYYDSCSEIDNYTFALSQLPQNGTLSGTPPNVTYTPTQGYEGMDSFTFTVNDGVWTSQPATVTLYVVKGPAVTAQCRFNQILLSWTLDGIIQTMENEGLGIHDFQVYRSLSAGGPYTLIYTTPDASQTSCVDMNVASGTIYYYVVAFQYEDSSTGIIYESPDSGEASASPCSLPSPIRDGFNRNIIPANDDNRTGNGESGDRVQNLEDIGYSINFFGNTYASLYVNNNGNVTFESYYDPYTPTTLDDLGTNIIAPFWADVDTRGSDSALVTCGTGTVNNNAAFGANWIDVGYFDEEDDKLNVFQLILINRPDRASGDYDIEFNYAQIQWETGDASDGDDGLGGYSAAVGFASVSGYAFEIIGSGIPGSFLDSNSTTGLIYGRFNSPTPGRYVFQFHNGSPLSNP